MLNLLCCLRMAHIARDSRSNVSPWSAKVKNKSIEHTYHVREVYTNLPGSARIFYCGRLQLQVVLKCYNISASSLFLFPYWQFAEDVKQGKGGRDFFLDPWWLQGPGYEVTANKRLWDLGAELVDNIPRSVEVGFVPITRVRLICDASIYVGGMLNTRRL